MHPPLDIKFGCVRITDHDNKHNTQQKKLFTNERVNLDLKLESLYNVEQFSTFLSMPKWAFYDITYMQYAILPNISKLMYFHISMSIANPKC